MIYDKLTPFEYLEFVAGLWSLDADVAETRARDLMDWLGLLPHVHERCEGFSKGMRQKVALAGALVHERMADRVGIIAGGRLIAEGTLDELRAQAGRGLSSLEDTFLALVAEQQAAA
jgi:ABC-2 type transport system ATP-binding protein